MSRIVVFLCFLCVLISAPAVAGDRDNAQAQNTQQYAYTQQQKDPDFFLVPWYAWFTDSAWENDDFIFDTKKPKAWGVSLGLLGRGWVSAEIDFGYSSNFFGDDEFLGDNDYMTLTGSAIIGPWIPAGTMRIRPYGLIGGGLARASVEGFAEFGDTSENRGVIDYGGGLFWYMTRNVGLRVDYRLLRDVGSDEDDEDGWGVTKTQFGRIGVGLLLAW